LVPTKTYNTYSIFKERLRIQLLTQFLDLNVFEISNAFLLKFQQDSNPPGF